MKKFRFKCSCPQCNKSWNGDSLKKISKRVAKHWNKKHSDEIKHSYEKIDSIVIDGHHVHDNEYVVEKIPIYITSFDVMDRLGLEDGFAVFDENKDYCDNCKCVIRKSENKIEIDDKIQCKKCYNLQKIEEKKNTNHSLSYF